MQHRSRQFPAIRHFTISVRKSAFAEHLEFAPMVKAMQEKQRIIEKQIRLIDELTKRVEALEKR